MGQMVFGVIVVCVFGTAAFGQPWAGSGTAEAPYQIWDACDMQAIGADANYWDAHFKLMADIDLGSYTGTSFNIIGKYPDKPFTGVFDGNEHTISNFTYKSNGVDYIGLFGYVDDANAELKYLEFKDANVDAGRGESAGNVVGCLAAYVKRGTVSRCGVDGGNVSGDEPIGGLVGWSGGVVTNCYSRTHVIGTYVTDDAGGLLGYNDHGIVSNCYAICRVEVDSSGWDVGCLVGINDEGTITNCYSGGSAYGEGAVGGLVGHNYYGMVSNCYSTSSVSGLYSIGGLVGENPYSTISNSYCTGGITGRQYVGGLVGTNPQGTIRNCYSSGSASASVGYAGGLAAWSYEGLIEDCYSAAVVAAPSYAGGLVASSYKDSFTPCFWNSDVNPDVNGVGNTSDPNVIGKTTAEMQTRSTFTNAGWDFEDIWRMCVDGVDYPLLSCQFVAGDFVCPDGVDFVDFAVLASAWLSDDTDPHWDPICDISEPKDNLIDELDLAVLCENWLEGI